MFSEYSSIDTKWPETDSENMYYFWIIDTFEREREEKIKLKAWVCFTKLSHNVIIKINSKLVKIESKQNRWESSSTDSSGDIALPTIEFCDKDRRRDNNEWGNKFIVYWWTLAL